MSEKRTPDNTPSKPTHDKLPKPMVVWTGHSARAVASETEIDARVILRYEWVLPGGAKEWEAHEAVIYEVIDGRDGLDNPIWRPLGRENIPVKFYSEFMKKSN